MAVSNCIRGARFHAIAAKDTTRIIDVIDAGVAFAGGNPLRLGVFRGFDINAARRAGRGTQETSNTLFESIFIPVKNVDSAVTRLEVDWLFGIIFCDGFPQHVAEGHAETFYERDKCFPSFLDNRWHGISV